VRARRPAADKQGERREERGERREERGERRK